MEKYTQSALDMTSVDGAVSVDPPALGNEQQQPMSKLAIIKNLALVSTSFLLAFSAYNGTMNLQTSLNQDDHLGNESLTIVYVAVVLSTLLLSTVVLFKLGVKWSLVISLLLHVTYPASNFFPVWYVMYAGAAITGLGGGPLWTSKSAYLTLLGEKYAALSGESSEVVVSRFFGIFYMVHRGSMFTGNIISSIVIGRPASHVQSADNDVISHLCGANYCYEELGVAFHHLAGNGSGSENDQLSIYRPTTLQTKLLFGIYVLVGVAAGIASVMTGPMLKNVGRKAIFTLGTLCNAAALVAMSTWSPRADSMVALSVFAALWAISNAVLSSQLVAFIAFMYGDGPKEAAFACNYLWCMSGICLWHATSTHMCLHLQIYVIAGLLALAMVGYMATELVLMAEGVKATRDDHHQRMDRIAG